MSWTDLAAQFALELAFGALVALAFVPRAPVGALFYRVLGSAAAAMVVLALGLYAAVGRADPREPAAWGAGLALLAYPLYSAPPRGARWSVGLGLGLLGSGFAVTSALREVLVEPDPALLALGTASALATGTVAGSVGLAMVLGHWYLTVPKLEVRHLMRLNRVAVGAMLVSGACLTVSCVAFADVLERAEPPLYGATGLFYLGTRVAVGLFLPLVFAAMAASSLRFQNTRSATGILYASTVLVLIGTALSLFLQDSYRVPL